MDKIHIGRSDLITLPLGVGTMAWSNSNLWGYGSRLSVDAVRSAFTTSLEAGLDFFDTAELYGNGHSERVLGELVHSSGKRVTIASKYAPLPWRLTAGSVTAAIDASLRHLGVPMIDLYQVHFPFGFMSTKRLMEVLAEAVQAGKIRYIGVSNYSTHQMRQAYAALDRIGIPLVSNQIEYSLIHRAPQFNGLLDACRELNVTVIAYSPLGRGVLTGKYHPGDHFSGFRSFYKQFSNNRLAEIQPLLDAMRVVGEAHGSATVSQVALNWLARQPGVFPIPGAKTAQQAADNAASINWDMLDAEAAKLDELSRHFLK